MRAAFIRPLLRLPRTLSAAAGLVAAGTLLVLSPFDFPCVFAAAGLDGPMCGGTRMLEALLVGDLPRALGFNAFAAVVLLPLVAALLVASARCELGRARSLWPAGARGLVCAHLLAGGLVLWTVLRNLPVEPFTVLAT
ncbi:MULTISPECIES: DUF2752 domain-containing protein [Actinopolyspora]|uniref:DUF2752 domain-containing protein n=1 Tax=Actinopolyspora saharensis TaxID=995062 RepID=A0A1H1DD59_9ACTN|nr:DUF2752 domain-containing protein [Actinopolyspora saharensis]SDQ74392.1 Protein of unknown function [Actinopolyspora saharensis]